MLCFDFVQLCHDACTADRPEMSCNLKLGPMAIRKGSKVRIVGPNGVGKVRVFH